MHGISFAMIGIVNVRTCVRPVKRLLLFDTQSALFTKVTEERQRDKFGTVSAKARQLISFLYKDLKRGSKIGVTKHNPNH